MLAMRRKDVFGAFCLLSLYGSLPLGTSLQAFHGWTHTVAPSVGECVRLLTDETAFIDAFRRSFILSPHPVNSLATDKLERIGQQAKIVQLLGNDAVRCEFLDGRRVDLPMRSIDSLVDCLENGQLCEESDHTLSESCRHGSVSLQRRVANECTLANSNTVPLEGMH